MKNPVKKLLRSGEGKKLRALQALVPDIGELEPEMSRLNDDELKAKTGEFKQRIDNGEDINDLLIESFAVVREAATRVIGQRHYDVQLVGGAALHFGWVAEMKTGEGKTLTSTLPIYLNALTGKGVHVVTVNDYLAQRDAEWMGQIYGWLGLETGLVIPGMRDSTHKRAQYAADITHGTNNELGFDYLRDNMAMSLDRKVQRGHAYCIVDEIDSILIDEARTPLIISGKLADAAKIYYQFASIVRGLQRDVHYDVDEEKRTVAPTEEGIHAVERALGIENLYDAVSANLVHQFQVALKGKGTVPPRQGLHRRQGRSEDRRRVHGTHSRRPSLVRWPAPGGRGQRGRQDQRREPDARHDHPAELLPALRQAGGYDRAPPRPKHRSSSTPTASTWCRSHQQAASFGRQVDLVYRSEMGKFEAVVDDIVGRNGAGQPVLVGTISVEKSELVSRTARKEWH